MKGFIERLLDFGRADRIRKARERVPVIDEKGREWWSRKKCVPVHVAPGDSITLLNDGEPMITESFFDSRTITEVGIFEDRTDEGQRMICGAFIEERK